MEEAGEVETSASKSFYEASSRSPVLKRMKNR
jgi:hypothetical protein